MLILPRSANTRNPNSLMIVLAVEGEHTEEQYFKPLRNGKIDLEILSTENGFSAPQHIEERMDSFLATNRGLVGGEFWLVLDVDRHHALQEVCAQAVQKGYRLAVSNPCFELWLWLHLEEVDNNLKTCSQLETALRSRLGGYNKSNLPVADFHSNISTAIERAKALTGSNISPIPAFPGTQIYQLMEQILTS
jgi:RloB-like protein